jgi:hypothetical protein
MRPFHRPAVLLMAPLLVVTAAAPPAIGAPVPGEVQVDWSAYRLTDVAWDDTGSLTAVADARDSTRTLTLRATSFDPTGAPTNPGLLRAWARSTRPEPPGPYAWRYVGQTAGDGSAVARFRVAVADGSRDVRVTYPGPGGIAPAPGEVHGSAVDATLTVRATTTALTSRRRAVAGRSILVHGRLDGRAGDATGTAVALQLRRRGTWQPAGGATVESGTHWRGRLPIPATARGSVRVRAVVTPGAEYPYAEGRSRTLAIPLR